MGTGYTFLAALGLSLVLTPAVRAFARKVKALSYPNERSVHRIPIPYLGGVAIYVASVAAMLLSKAAKDPALIKALVSGGFVILVVGIVDDLAGLKPWQKLIGQFLSGIPVLMSRVSISFVTDPVTGTVKLLGMAALPITLIWIMSFENLINLSDGLDGLAAGVTAITAVVIVFAASKAGAPRVCPVAAAVAGSVLGFLPYNFHPASIFMGDAGALYLGLALAVLSIQGLVKSTVMMSVFAPLLTLLIPISDAAFAVIRRKFMGMPASGADRDHLHHRLLELGLGYRQSVFIIYLVSLGFGALGLVASFIPIYQGASIAGLAVMALLVVMHRTGLLTVNRHSDGHMDGHSHRRSSVRETPRRP